eukprot:CAMPEP_0197886492 /NCGR_PEP_ID=MMETSP1439-20131203/16592_1 /TAXON_ID=66791 /ORGANISM="Gonyaulax spinifera, Strain CCMP409" /LENGTH=112 /DNA_ID=CAMNT_0043506287 /DNA_START=63 /DNA_END=398 /DNA_ORIENTATION=-
MANKLNNLPPFLTDKSNPVGYVVQGAYEFGVDSRRLVQRCTKPDAKEFKKIAVACAIGFAIMGFIGYTVKLVFIPTTTSSSAAPEQAATRDCRWSDLGRRRWRSQAQPARSR